MIIAIARWAANRLEMLAWYLHDWTGEKTADLEMPYPEGPEGDE